MKTSSRNAIAARAVLIAVLAAVLSAGGFAQTKVVNAAWHQHNHGSLKITALTEVGGTMLEPGTYEVKVRNSKSGSTVEFSRWTYNPYSDEGLPGWNLEVVATVNAVPQQTQTAAMRTGLLLASSGGKAVGLEIRGDTVQYLL